MWFSQTASAIPEFGLDSFKMREGQRIIESSEELEKLKKDVLNRRKSNFFSIIDKYICLSHGLPSPTGPSAVKSPVSRVRSHSKIVSRDSTYDFSGFPDEELQEEVEETLRSRRLDLGLPEDYPLKELDVNDIEKEVHRKSANRKSVISETDDICRIHSPRDVPLQNKEKQSLTREGPSSESVGHAVPLQNKKKQSLTREGPSSESVGHVVPLQNKKKQSLTREGPSTESVGHAVPLQNKEKQSLTREGPSSESDGHAVVIPTEEVLSTKNQYKEDNSCCFCGRRKDKAQNEQHRSTGNASLKEKRRHTHLCLLDSYDLVAVTVFSNTVKNVRGEKSKFPDNALCIIPIADVTNKQSEADCKSNKKSSTSKQKPSDQNISAKGDTQRFNDTTGLDVNNTRKSRRIQDRVKVTNQLQRNDTKRDQRMGERREISHSKNDVSKGTNKTLSIVLENLRNKKTLSRRERRSLEYASLNDSVLMNPDDENDICNSVEDVCSGTKASQNDGKNGNSDGQQPLIICDALNELPERHSKGDKQKSKQQDQSADAFKADRVNSVHIHQIIDKSNPAAITSPSANLTPSKLLAPSNSCLHNPEQSQVSNDKETSESLVKRNESIQANRSRVSLNKTGKKTVHILDGKRRNEKKQMDETQVTTKNILQKQRNVKRQKSCTDYALLHDSVCMNADDGEIQSSPHILPTKRSVTSNKEHIENDDYIFRKDNNGNIYKSSADSSEHSWLSKKGAREGRKFKYKDRRTVKTIHSHDSDKEDTASNEDGSYLASKVCPEKRISRERKTVSEKNTKNRIVAAEENHPAKRKRLVIDYVALYDSVQMNPGNDEGDNFSLKNVASGEKALLCTVEKQSSRIFDSHNNANAQMSSSNLTDNDQRRQSQEDNALNKKDFDSKKRRIEPENIQVCNNARNPVSSLSDSNKHIGHTLPGTGPKERQISAPACVQKETSYSAENRNAETFESSKFNPHSDDSSDSFASINHIPAETTISIVRSYHNSFPNMRKLWQKSLQSSQSSQEKLDKVHLHSESVMDSGINSIAKKWTSSVSFWDLSDEDMSQKNVHTQSVVADSSKDLAVKKKIKPLLHRKYLKKPHLSLCSQSFKVNGRIVDPARYF